MKIAVFAACAAMLIGVPASAMDVYQVQVTRVEQDTYKVEGQGGGIFIKTAYCYEFATWENAVVVLKMQPFSGSVAIGKILFTNGWSMCQIDSIYR